MEEYFVEEKTSFDRFLDFLVFIAVFVVTIFLVLEFVAATGKINIDIVSLSTTYFWVDVVVLFIFIADLIRLRIESPDWKYFFKEYWLDILATIPFGLLAGYLHTADYGVVAALKWARAGKLAAATKVQKMSRVSKIGKEFKAAAHLKQESDEYQKKNRL